MHLVDRQAGFLGSTPIVGGTVPLAVGAAWAAKQRGEQRIAVAFFGDGTFEEGVVHESLNFAALKKLPVIFVCENNLYSVYTSLENRQPDRSISTLAAAHGWNAAEGDGNDVFEVSALARQCIDNIKSGDGPQFLELRTYRWLEHCGPFDDDNLGYRPEKELDSWKARCPLNNLRQQMTESSSSILSDLDVIEKKVCKEIDLAFEFAAESAFPCASNNDAYLYAD